jgi:hypothetical protein
VRYDWLIFANGATNLLSLRNCEQVLLFRIDIYHSIRIEVFLKCAKNTKFEKKECYRASLFGILKIGNALTSGGLVFLHLIFD